MLYEMLTGKLPFTSNTRKLLLQKIKTEQLQMNQTFSEELKDLLTKLLAKDPEERINSMKVIKKHPWFRGTLWNEFESKTMQVPV